MVSSSRSSKKHLYLVYSLYFNYTVTLYQVPGQLLGQR